VAIPAIASPSVDFVELLPLDLVNDFDLKPRLFEGKMTNEV
jgi:hypothetical protein